LNEGYWQRDRSLRMDCLTNLITGRSPERANYDEMTS
jgi:hypothetical protein